MAHVSDVLLLEVSNAAAAPAAQIVLEGAPLGYRPFSSRCASGDTIHYMIRAVDVVGRPQGAWECGRGTLLLSGGIWSLRRDIVTGSSNSNAAVNFPAGLKNVSLAALATDNQILLYDLQAALGLDLVGQVAYFPTSAPPAGWLKANGAAVSRTVYARLFERISTVGGAGDGSTTFNVPDMRGVFPRGLDDGRGLDTGRALGSYQDSANLSHNHGINDGGHAHSVYDPGHAHGAWTDSQGYHDHANGSNVYGGPWGLQSGSFAGTGNIMQNGMHGGYRTDGAGSHGHNVGIGGAGTGISIYGAGTGISIQAQGGAEARPRNTALLACIKF